MAEVENSDGYCSERVLAPWECHDALDKSMKMAARVLERTQSHGEAGIDNTYRRVVAIGAPDLVQIAVAAAVVLLM